LRHETRRAFLVNEKSTLLLPVYVSICFSLQQLKIGALRVVEWLFYVNLLKKLNYLCEKNK